MVMAFSLGTKDRLMLLAAMLHKITQGKATMNDAVLAKLDRCAGLLAECQTADQAKKLAELSEVARVYAKPVGASREVVNRAARKLVHAEEIARPLPGG